MNSPLTFVKNILCFLARIGACFVLLVFPASADEKDALAAIKKLGGAVRGVAQNSEASEIDFHLRGDVLTDAGLVHLTGLQNVVNLHVGGTQVTDAGLAHLKGLSSLRRLHLENTEVGDAGGIRRRLFAVYREHGYSSLAHDLWLRISAPVFC